MIDDSASGPLSPETLDRYRLTVLPRVDGCHLCLPEEVADFLQERVVAGHPLEEYLGAVFVDDLARPLGISVPYLGYLASRRADPPTVLAPGMLLGADGLMLFHHRPGEPPRPTRRDVLFARRVLKAGEVAGVQLLDHLLLGDGGWTSLQDGGRVPFQPLGVRAPRDGRARVKPKYQNPEQPTQTWSGRGKMAVWLQEKLAAGAELEDFAVAE